jgi:hypothetical protein
MVKQKLVSSLITNKQYARKHFAYFLEKKKRKLLLGYPWILLPRCKRNGIRWLPKKKEWYQMLEECISVRPFGLSWLQPHRPIGLVIMLGFCRWLIRQGSPDLVPSINQS